MEGEEGLTNHTMTTSPSAISRAELNMAGGKKGND